MKVTHCFEKITIYHPTLCLFAIFTLWDTPQPTSSVCGTFYFFETPPTYLICLRMSSLCSVYSWSCLAVAVSISACSEFTRSVWLFSRAVFNWPLSISWLWVTIVNSDIKADIFSCNIQRDVKVTVKGCFYTRFVFKRMILDKVCQPFMIFTTRKF